MHPNGTSPVIMPTRLHRMQMADNVWTLWSQTSRQSAAQHVPSTHLVATIHTED
jgi:hypothetical protein